MNTESFESVMEAAMPLLSGDCVFESCPDENDDCMHCAIHMADRLKAAHDREIRDTAQQQYSRGFHDGQHSMDAEHRAIAIRLRALPLDGGSHENLSQIARAIYHSDFGWTQGACASLRDELIDLMGGVSGGNLTKSLKTIKLSEPTTDQNHGNAEKPSITEVSDDGCGCAGGGACNVDCGGSHREQVEVSGGCTWLRDGTVSDSLIPVWPHDEKHTEVSDGGTADDCGADSRGGDGGGDLHMAGLVTYDVLWNERHKAVCELRNMHLDTGSAVKKLAIALGVKWNSDNAVRSVTLLQKRLIHLLGGDQPSGIDVLRAMEEREVEGRITDELREFVGTFSKRLSISVAEVNAIADRIDAQFDRICQQQEAVLQSTIAELVEQRDELQAKLDSAEDAMNRAAGRWADADAECRELQAKLDEYDRMHVELPNDANGEVFRVGCTVRIVERHPDVLLTVHSMTLCDDGEWLLMARDDEDEYFCNQSASEFEVCDNPQDTAESIVRDLSMGLITESLAIERIGALNG